MSRRIGDANDDRSARCSDFFFQAEGGIRDFCLFRGLGDVYKGQGRYMPKASLPAPSSGAAASSSSGGVASSSRGPVSSGPYDSGAAKGGL